MIEPKPKEKHGWMNSTKELSKHGMNFEPLSLADSFPQLFLIDSLERSEPFLTHENESLTDAWLRMKEMLRNCHVGGIFLYKTPNQAYQLLEDKVLLKLDWDKNLKIKSSPKKTVAFADRSSSNSDTDKIMARMDAMT
ncbi:hypothetical protein Tco_0306093, partial [Tanacetum coccineum]